MFWEVFFLFGSERIHLFTRNFPTWRFCFGCGNRSQLAQHTGLTQIRWLGRRHACLPMLIHSGVGFILLTWLGNSWKPGCAWWRQQGLPLLSASKWLGASLGEQKANSNDLALVEQKRSQSRSMEVINKRQHILNVQEICPLCGKIIIIMKQTWLWSTAGWRSLSSKFLGTQSVLVAQKLMRTKTEVSSTWSNVVCCY